MNDDHYVRDLLIVLGVGVAGMLLCLFAGLHGGEDNGYIKALIDIKKGNPPKFVLVEQADNGSGGV